MAGKGLMAGIGQGLSQMGQMWMTSTMEQQKEERLAALEEKRYSRDRTAKLADYEMAKTDRATEIDADRKFRSTEAAADRVHREGETTKSITAQQEIAEKNNQSRERTSTADNESRERIGLLDSNSVKTQVSLINSAIAAGISEDQVTSLTRNAIEQQIQRSANDGIMSDAARGALADIKASKQDGSYDPNDLLEFRKRFGFDINGMIGK